MIEKQNIAGLGAKASKQLNTLDNLTLAMKPELMQKFLNENLRFFLVFLPLKQTSFQIVEHKKILRLQSFC